MASFLVCILRNNSSSFFFLLNTWKFFTSRFFPKTFSKYLIFIFSFAHLYSVYYSPCNHAIIAIASVDFTTSTAINATVSITTGITSTIAWASSSSSASWCSLYHWHCPQIIRLSTRSAAMVALNSRNYWNKYPLTSNNDRLSCNDVKFTICTNIIAFIRAADAENRYAFIFFLFSIFLSFATNQNVYFYLNN